MQTRKVENIPYGPAPISRTIGRKTVNLPAGLRVEPVTRYPTQTRPQFWLTEFPASLFSDFERHDASHYGVWLELWQLDATCEEQLAALAQFPDEPQAMRSIRVHLANGTSYATNINGTRADVVRYFVGQELNMGGLVADATLTDVVEVDDMQRVAGVEFID
jgi:hypothetical protein